MVHTQTVMVHEQPLLLFEYFTVVYTNTPQENEPITAIYRPKNKDIREDSDDSGAENNSAGANRTVQMVIIERETPWHMLTSWFVKYYHKDLSTLKYACLENPRFFNILFIFYCSYSCLHSPLMTPPHATHHHLHLQSLHPLPFPWIFYTCSLMTSPLLSPIIPLPLPSGYCQFVLYFNVSGYILLACLF